MEYTNEKVIKYSFEVNDKHFWNVYNTKNAKLAVGMKGLDGPDDNFFVVTGDPYLALEEVKEIARKHDKKFMSEIVETEDETDSEVWFFINSVKGAGKEALKNQENVEIVECKKNQANLFAKTLKKGYTAGGVYSDEYTEENYQRVKKTIKNKVKNLKFFFVKEISTQKILGCFWLKVRQEILILDGFTIIEKERKKGYGIQTIKEILKKFHLPIYGLTDEEIFKGFYNKFFNCRILKRVSYVETSME